MVLTDSIDPELQREVEHNRIVHGLIDEVFLGATAFAIPVTRGERLAVFLGDTKDEWIKSFYRLEHEGLVKLYKWVPVLTDEGIRYMTEHPLDLAVKELVEIFSQNETRLATIGRAILEQRNL